MHRVVQDMVNTVIMGDLVCWLLFEDQKVRVRYNEEGVIVNGHVHIFVCVSVCFCIRAAGSLKARCESVIPRSHPLNLLDPG